MLKWATWSVRAGVVAVVAFLTFISSTSHGANQTLHIVVFAIGLVALMWWFFDSRSEPAGLTSLTIAGLIAIALTSGLATFSPGGTALVSLVFIAVMEAAADSDAVVGWVVAGSGVLALQVGAIIWSADAVEVVTFPLLMATAFVLGRNRRAYLVQAQQSEALLRQSQQFRQQQEQVAVLEERARIAREVHDVLAHSLGALGIHVQATRAVLESGDSPQALVMLDQARRLTSEGLAETRRAVQALRGDTVRLDEQLAMLVDTHRERYRTTAELVVDGDRRDLTPEATVALARAAQEGLVNAAKHAPGAPLTVHLHFGGSSTHLTINNPLMDASGGPDEATSAPAKPAGVDGGYGLTGMRERLLLLGGTLDAGLNEGEWIVSAEVPA